MALTTDDIVAIRQLYAAYCFAIDERDGEAFSQCFTADGSMGGGPGGPPVVGRRSLARFAAKARSGIRHVVVNVHAEGEGDVATGRAYFAAFGVGDGPARLLTTGTYRDTLRREDGTWCFAERAYTPDA